MRKRILLLTTGGTIACTESVQGLKPTLNGNHILRMVPEIKVYADVSCREVMNMDSTNIQPEDWVRIAEAVWEEQQRYDGIVVLHGTDTMTYSATAVSFMTIGIQKPVVFTGAQLPIVQTGTDGIRNLLDAIRAACQKMLKGVFVVFHKRILNGCSVSKTDTFALDAFQSINMNDVGCIKETILIQYHPHRRDGCFQSWMGIKRDVLLIKLYPGMEPGILEYAKTVGYRIVILETFGAGGIPNIMHSFLPYIEDLKKQGILTAITTQCCYGASDLDIYEVGKAALENGAVCTGKMTREALLAKSMWALSITDNLEKLKEILLMDFCGEFGRNE